MAGDDSFVEHGVDDAARAQPFYRELFGWRIEAPGGGVSITGPNVPGGIHGGDVGARPLHEPRASGRSPAR